MKWGRDTRMVQKMVSCCEAISLVINYGAWMVALWKAIHAQVMIERQGYRRP